MEYGEDEEDSEIEDHEEAVEEARAEGYELGKKEASGFGCGCLTGSVLTLAAIYMGWCHPYTS